MTAALARAPSAQTSLEVARLQAELARLEARRASLTERLAARPPGRLGVVVSVLAMAVLGMVAGLAPPMLAYILPHPSPPDDAAITLKRTPCYGACPTYEVTVHADGRVEYDGFHDVEVSGHATSSIPAASARKLFALLARSSFFDMSDGYTYPASDGPGAITTVHWGGQTKQIRDNVGFTGEMRRPAPSPYCVPPSLTRIEDHIDIVAHTGGWVGGLYAVDKR